MSSQNDQWERSRQNLNNFKASYTLSESSQMLNLVFDHVTEGIHYAALSRAEKERMLDFLESLEELLLAVDAIAVTKV
ncbi:MAG: hypothetical protein ACYCZO_15290 [Daejeonella sp.]